MNDIKDRSELLHDPGRADKLSDVDNHLNTAARLSRVLWNALINPDIDTSDERDREALEELAAILVVKPIRMSPDSDRPNPLT